MSKVDRSELHGALTLANRASSSGTTMPILANALLRPSGDALVVTATNLVVAVTVRVAATDAVGRAVCADAAALHKIVGKMPASSVTLETDDRDWLTVEAGRSRIRVAGLPARDFPRIPEMPADGVVTVSGSDLAEMIPRVIPSICQDETRVHLNGVFFEGDGTLRMVSTDGHRLTKTERDGDARIPGVIVPRKGIDTIRAVLGSGECRVAVQLPYLFVSTGGATVSVKLIEGFYPPYSQVVPQSARTAFTASRKGLMDSVERVGLVASELAGIRLHVGEQGLEISCESDGGDARETVDVVDRAGPPVSVGINPRYLVDFLRAAATDDVRVALNGELDPVRIDAVGDPDLCVIMPMRV